MAGAGELCPTARAPLRQKGTVLPGADFLSRTQPTTWGQTGSGRPRVPWRGRLGMAGLTGCQLRLACPSPASVSPRFQGCCRLGSPHGAARSTASEWQEPRPEKPPACHYSHVTRSARLVRGQPASPCEAGAQLQGAGVVSQRPAGRSRASVPAASVLWAQRPGIAEEGEASSGVCERCVETKPWSPRTPTEGMPCGQEGMPVAYWGHAVVTVAQHLRAGTHL